MISWTVRHHRIVSSNQPAGPRHSTGHSGGLTQNQQINLASQHTAHFEKLCHSSRSTTIRRAKMFWPSSSAAGFICQQYTGATHTPCLFSPLADVSTSSGMHSSCPSFASATDVCLAICKIRSPSFFSVFFFSCLYPIYFLSLKKENLHQAQDR